MSAIELRTPEEWSALYGVTIMDPDGWRNEGVAWGTPVSELAYRRLEQASTVQPAKRPVFTHIRAEGVHVPDGAYNLDRRGMPWSIARIDDVRRCSVFVTDTVMDHFMAGFAYGFGLRVIAIDPALAGATDLDGVIRVGSAAQANEILANYVRTYQ